MEELWFTGLGLQIVLILFNSTDNEKLGTFVMCIDCAACKREVGGAS